MLLPRGVTIGGIHVGGLSPDAAFAVVKASFRAPLVLTLGAHRVEVGPASLGAVAYAKAAVARARVAKPGTAVPLGVSVDGASVRKLVVSLGKRYGREPIDSKLMLRNLEPFITKGEPGKELDQKSAIAAVLRALRENRRTGVVLPYDDIPQKISRANFGAVIVIHRGTNHLYLYRGMKPWRTFTVATGQAIYPTPLGRFHIIVKWKNPWWYPPARRGPRVPSRSRRGRATRSGRGGWESRHRAWGSTGRRIRRRSATPRRTGASACTSRTRSGCSTTSRSGRPSTSSPRSSPCPHG